MTAPGAGSVAVDQIQVIAHRGSSSDEPEHTLASYRRALDEGADGLECDVRLTRDQHLVCVHDRKVNRTSDGRGVVSGLELADLQELDFGSWRERAVQQGYWLLDDEDDESPDRDATGVLTLDHLLDLVQGAGRRVDLAIETKHPTRYAGLVELHLARALVARGLDKPRPDGSSPVRIMSFSSLSLRRVHGLVREVPTVYLMDKVPIRYRAGELPYRVGIAGPGVHVIRRHPRYPARVHREGHKIHVWTVDTPEDVDLMVATGVDAIITNRPAEVLTQLGR